MSDALAVVGLVLNYRDATRTARCVRSLLDEGAGHVLVWDNSTDGGKSASELAKLIGSASKVDIVTSIKNLGFARGVNRGLAWLEKHRPERAVLLINNDAVLHQGAIDVLQAALAGEPKAWLAYPDIDHGGQVIGTAYYQRLTGLLGMKRPLPGSFGYASGCCLLVNMTVSGTELFDPTFFMYGEDMELGYRLRRTPGAMRHVACTLVSHEGSASSGMGSEFYEMRIVAGHFLLAHRIAEGRIDLFLMQVGRWVALSCRAVVRGIKYRSPTPLQSLWRGWCLAQGEKKQ